MPGNPSLRRALRTLAAREESGKGRFVFLRLGAIGLARCFATAGSMKRAFYSEEDPFCENRQPNDQQFAIDHFFVKLFKTADTLQTAAGRVEGAHRVAVMKQYLKDLSLEITKD